MISIPLIPSEEVTSASIWIPIFKSYRYYMVPTKEQYINVIRTLETLRHLYNWAWAERKDSWKNGGWSVQYEDQQGYLTVLRNKNDDFGKELREVYTDVEQDQLHRVDFAYQRYFNRCKNNKANPKKYKKPGYPRSKSRNRMKSLRFTRYEYGCHILDRKGNKDVKGNVLRLSKIGDIKFIKHTEIGDPGIPFLIKTITIKKEVDKLIFIPAIETFIEIKVPIDVYKKLGLKSDMPIIIEEGHSKKKSEKVAKELKGLLTKISKAMSTSKDVKSEIKTIEELKKGLDDLNDKYVGNDMGLPNLMTDSNGEKTEAPDYLAKSAKRLRKEQQKLSRKKKYDVIDEKTKKVKRDPKTNKKIWKGSKNRDKQVEKVAKVHIHVANQRRYYGHIVSKGKVKDNDLNAFENSDIQKMMKNRRYSKRLADASWGQIQRFTKYKAEWAGKMVDFVDPAYTSQSCSNCGRLVGKMIEEIFKCPFCGLTINVHENAARNIRNRSPIYQQKLDEIYNRLSDSMKEEIILSAEKLRDNIYCWSLDPEDSWDDNKRINRDAAAQIYAFGEMASTQLETVERATSWNKEAVSRTEGEIFEDMIFKPRPLGRSS